MSRFVFSMFLTASIPLVAEAQVVAVRVTRTYTPIVIQPSYLPPTYYPQLNAYNLYPQIAPSYPSTLNIYPQVPVTYSYFANPYAPYAVPSSGVYSATYSSSTGFGPFRARSSFNQLYYYP